ncbi:diacylglycerol/lipid kinase family protein [Phormidium sp. CCY1219]|uniref:diacylglycerol/lipid kinase family protein n=1 Tax=Phormidium sp. CCY1219 TaxID=2886104 RepID=UPI002D1F0507|nr:diacylglycerol kinase family protein [Phormidium sp. CCY1219]MEB3829393.1 hypothetical protein [Phormidium sp. CCY1219]
MPKPILFSNPNAYGGRTAKWTEYARKLLRDFGIEHEAIATQPDRKTIEIVRRAIDESGVRLAIAMGGDGTFSEVAQGVLSSQHASEVTVALLPTGTGNNQGKSFGMKSGDRALPENVRAIAEGKTMLLDAGRLQHLDEENRAIKTDWFVDSLSFGWDAEIVEKSNRDRATVSSIPFLSEIYRDQLIYVGASIQHSIATLYRDRAFDVCVEIDGGKHHYQSAIDIIVKNTLVYGGDWIPAPDSLPDDGYFELIPVMGRGEFFWKAIANLRSGPFSEADFRRWGIALSPTRRGSAFQFEILPQYRHSIPAGQMDGEEYQVSSRFRIDVRQQVLRFVVPQSYSRDRRD